MYHLLNIAKHWAIEPDYLKLMGSYLAGAHFSKESVSKNQLPINKQTTTSKQDSIAVIPITGAITAQETFLSSLLGGTSLDVFLDEFQAALQDDSIKAILLNIDSPGGVAVGPSEIADYIYNARNQKPIWGYIARHGCSAAYWLAAGCEKIIANRSALVGSIGVVSTVPVQENPDSEGYRHIEIVSTHAQNKRPDPRTDEGLHQIKRELDAIESEFIESIARYRNLTVSTVSSDFGQGGVLVGKAAKACKMVDEIGSFEEVITSLLALTQLQTQSQSNNQQQLRRNFNMNEMTTNGVQHDITIEHVQGQQMQPIKEEKQDSIAASPLMNANDIKTQYPFVYESIKQHGFELGCKAENERLQAIDAATLLGYEALAAKAKNDPNMTGEKFALQIIALEKAKGSQFIAQAERVEKELPVVSPNIEATSNPNKILPSMTVEQKAKAMWNDNPKIRAEFGSFEVFESYCEAFDHGQVRIFGQKKGVLS